MDTDFTIYTGLLNFREIEFSFMFDCDELRLIPIDVSGNKQCEDFLLSSITKVDMKENRIKMDEQYLIGTCNENRHTMIFITEEGSYIKCHNSALFIKIIAYIDNKFDREYIDKISFTSPEINCIHPVDQAFKLSYDTENLFKNGEFSLSMLDFESTSSKKQEFIVDDVTVYVQFSISRSFAHKIGDPPITLNSVMTFEFAQTKDYLFILKLWRIAKKFIQFLCYRKNVFLPKVDLSAPYEENMHEKFATLHVLGESGILESEILEKEKYIKQIYIAGSEGKILADISSNSLYTRHFPDSYKSGRSIDAARFIMITAAFEWEFQRVYPEGVPKTEETIKIENKAEEALSVLIEANSGKLKKKFKFLKNFIRSDSLQTEIIKTGKDFDEIIGIFGKALYKLNNEKLDYSEMGQRLADQRNHFAHGDLDKEFIGLSLLDLVYLEYIVYAMQLKYYGVDDDNIRKSINDLFGLHYAL